MLSKPWLLRSVRYGLPIALIATGFVVLCTVSDSRRYDGFAMLVGSGVAVAALNFLYRLSVTSDRDREAEQRAREFLSRHGHWPDEVGDD